MLMIFYASVFQRYAMLFTYWFFRFIRYCRCLSAIIFFR